SQIVTGCEDGTVRFWNALTGAGGSVLKHPLPVRALTISRDGRRIATACMNNGTARVWDASTGKALTKPLQHPGNFTVLDASLSPDGTVLATACADGQARIWDVARQEVRALAEMKHSYALLCLCFSPDGRWLATGGTDHTARVWDASSGQPRTPFL